ncbi:MAG: Lactaldehyde reductase [bacterium ADurb.Bin429]|nr:MAG: Lactaldehyde reductase [bacterium ADurb.Bin429]
MGSGRLLTRDPLPFIAIPTTAGTGSEVTKNAVISSRRDGYKKSLRDPRMIADIVILDADLTCSLPPHLTAWSGLDAVTQLIETYTSRYAQPYTDALALRGLRHARALPETYRDGTKLSTRGAMLLAAHFSGLCLANAGLGAAHGIAAALCAHADIPHGLACAVSLPWVMAMNASVVGAQYVEAVAEFTGEQTDVAGAIDAIWRLLAELAIPRVTALPALEPLCANAALPALAAACHGNSLRGNPRALADEDLIHLLRAMRDTEHPRMLL